MDMLILWLRNLKAILVSDTRDVSFLHNNSIKFQERCKKSKDLLKCAWYNGVLAKVKTNWKYCSRHRPVIRLSPLRWNNLDDVRTTSGRRRRDTSAHSSEGPRSSQQLWLRASRERRVALLNCVVNVKVL